MKFRPTAIGYVRSDISGVRQAWDETEVRSAAALRGFDFAKMIVIDGRTGRPLLAGLKATIARIEVEAVFVPSTKHFEGGTVPCDLRQTVDVITVSPENTYTRTGSDGHR
ncbi:hypothetical protein HLB23_10380 [Nocardia uniformis]|uniref:Uncharacterized protein n=1 Tax=Nocardia uniformis TaxID=53432 RepID=A0A849BVN4_9NOCA|nr:hypothetical protein [Nocardia uniformis]NNH70264.1 hypothetical protein [Nocardia uniformis]